MVGAKARRVTVAIPYSMANYRSGRRGRQLNEAVFRSYGSKVKWRYFNKLGTRMTGLGEEIVSRIAILAVMIATLCGSTLCQQSAVFDSYYEGNRYDFWLTHEQLLSTPAWLEDGPNPPLSPRTAESAALSYLKTLFDNASDWRLEEIKLVPVSERWVYVIVFIPPPPPNCYDCMVTPFNVVVTMDGIAVPALVSRWKSQHPRVK